MAPPPHTVFSVSQSSAQKIETDERLETQIRRAPRAAEMPFVALFGLDSSLTSHRSSKQCDGWLLSGSASNYVSRAVEVPFFTLFDLEF